MGISCAAKPTELMTRVVRTEGTADRKSYRRRLVIAPDLVPLMRYVSSL